MRLLLLALALGCYRPSPRSASYECGADGECPSSLQCVCGMCVDSPEAAACSFAITVRAPVCPDDATALCVKEEEPFPVTVVAYRDANRTQPSTYAGTARFESTWGHAFVTDHFTFERGIATAHVLLDRATPGQKAFLTVRAGTAVGASGTAIYVDPPPYQLETGPIVAPPFGWATANVALPAIDRGPDGYTMYFVGYERGGYEPRIGVARSRDGNTWTPDAAPLFSPPAGTAHFSPSVMRTSDANVELFFSSGGPGRPLEVMLASSRDGGRVFGAPATVFASGACPECSLGIVYPWALLSPDDESSWMMFFSTLYKGGMAPQLGVARSVDRGQNWNVDRVPTPRTRMSGGESAFSARVLHDPFTGIYRMWYVEGAKDCRWTIAYATSSDGQFWTGPRPQVKSLAREDVPWLPEKVTTPDGRTILVAGLLPGAIEPPDWSSPSPRYTLWFSAVVADERAPEGCISATIGRAFRQ